jgi:hypothetical protein
LKIFTETNQCISAELSSLNPVLTFHWEGISKRERSEGKSNLSSPFVLVDQPCDADICVMPKEWNYYLWHRKQDEALALAEQARSNGKKILIWFRGDLPPRIPFQNAVVFKCAINRSQSRTNHFAAPFFINDPTIKFSDGEIVLREKAQKAKVGFCGYGAVKPLKLAYSIAANSLNYLKISLGRSNYESAPIIPATMLRARALSHLKRDKRIVTQFVIRDKYKAGAWKNPTDLQSATKVFFNNIYETDYTLCIRGYGNWSVRFYETLACGRIPIFIDTDCRLPFDFALDWKKYCVWVDSKDLSHIADIIADFHSRLTPDRFLELQKSCRRLWQERLSLEGFMTHLSDHFADDKNVIAAKSLTAKMPGTLVETTSAN